MNLNPRWLTKSFSLCSEVEHHLSLLLCHSNFLVEPSIVHRAVQYDLVALSRSCFRYQVQQYPAEEEEEREREREEDEEDDLKIVGGLGVQGEYFRK